MSAIVVGGILSLVIPLGTVIVITAWLWLRFRRSE